MKTNIYLMVNGSGGVRVRKTKSSLAYNEIAIKLALEVPDILFKKPLLEAAVKVDEKVARPTKITPDILVNTKKLIEESTGMKIILKIVEVPPDEEEKPRT